MQDQNQHKPLTSENKEEAQIDRSAIKSNYKRWEKELSYQDLVKHVKTCYNTYNELSFKISLPKDVRLSYLDKAATLQELLDYLERQTA